MGGVYFRTSALFNKNAPIWGAIGSGWMIYYVACFGGDLGLFLRILVTVLNVP